MTKKTTIISILLLITLIIIIMIWVYAFDNGTIKITTGLTDYKITIDKQITICSNDPCTIKIKSDIYSVRFEKENYTPVTSTIYIKRGKTTPLILEPKKTIILQRSDIVKDIKKPKLPTSPSFDSKYSVVVYIWNKKRDKYLFLDGKDDRLKIIDSEGEITLVTTLKNIENPVYFYWSSDEKRILINKNNDFYFIDVTKGSRKKHIIDFDPTHILWSLNNDYILLNDEENTLYIINWNKQNYIESLNTKLDLSLSVWVNENQLLIYKTDEKVNKTNVYLYNPLTTTMKQLTQKFDFPVDDIYYDSEINTGFLHDSEEDQWYKLEL